MEGGKREGGASRVAWSKEVTSTPPHPPRTVELISKRCCSWEHLLFVLDHLSVTIKKKTSARTSMLLQGERRTKTPPSLPPTAPTFTSITSTILRHQIHHCTSSAMKPLHLVSSPEPFGRCSAARHERRGDRLMDERNSK